MTASDESAKEWDVNEIDGVGNTPLHWACASGKMQNLMLLLDCGARLDAKNYMGLTPKQCAQLRAKYHIGKLKGRRAERARRRAMGLTSVCLSSSKSFTVYI